MSVNSHYEDMSKSQRDLLDRLHFTNMDIERLYEKTQSKIIVLEQQQKHIDIITQEIEDRLSKVQFSIDEKTVELRSEYTALTKKYEQHISEQEMRINELYYKADERFYSSKSLIDSSLANLGNLEETYNKQIKVSEKRLEHIKLELDKHLTKQDIQFNELFNINNEKFMEYDSRLHLLIDNLSLTDTSYQNQIEELNKRIKQVQSIATSNNLLELQELSNKITELHDSLFKNKVETDNSIYNNLTAIEQQYNDLFITDSPDSKASQIDKFYKKVFGNTDEEELSLNNKLDEQLVQFKNIETQARSVLGLSSDAGLAGGFISKVKEAKTGRTASIITFIISIVAIIILNAILFDLNDFKEMQWDKFLLKLTLNAPLIWLATIANINLNRFSRLEQEYSHKESLARSFERYKSAIQDLNIIIPKESIDLQVKLMEVCLDALRINPAESSEKAKSDLDLLDFIKTQFTSNK